MNNFLKIENDGELDVRLIALMGGSTKSNEEFKIGQFGTGLKYVLAYVIRNGVDFRIKTGEHEVKLSYDVEVIRDEEFKVLYIDGERTSITDKMGKDWKAWMIVRELYSNALDEGGATYGTVQEEEIQPGQKDKTAFYIEMTPEFLQVYNEWNKYFIVNQQPMYEDRKVKLYPAEGTLKLYKQGILIHEDNTEDSLFNYDIKNAEINELREYKGLVGYDLADIILDISDQKTITYLLEHINDTPSNGKKYFEAHVDLNWFKSWGNMNNAWKETINQAKVIDQETKQKIQSKGANIDLSHTIEVPKNLYKVLTKNFKGIGAVRFASKMNEFYEVYDAKLEEKKDHALKTLEGAGYFISPELKFIFGEFGDKSTLAKIDIDEKEIMVSHKMKDMALFDFCAMVIEENEHYNTGYSDCTRDFQQHFINLYTKAILDKSGVNI